MPERITIPAVRHGGTIISSGGNVPLASSRGNLRARILRTLNQQIGSSIPEAARQETTRGVTIRVNGRPHRFSFAEIHSGTSAQPAAQAAPGAESPAPAAAGRRAGRGGGARRARSSGAQGPTVVDAHADTTGEAGESGSIRHVNVRLGNQTVEIPYRHDGEAGLSDAERQEFLANLRRESNFEDNEADLMNQRVTIEGSQESIRDIAYRLRDESGEASGPDAVDVADDVSRAIEDEEEFVRSTIVDGMVGDTLLNTAEVRRRSRAQRNRIRMIIASLVRGGELTWEKFMAIMDAYGISKRTYTREAMAYVLEQQNRDEGRQSELTDELRELSQSGDGEDNAQARSTRMARLNTINTELRQLGARLNTYMGFVRDAKSEQDRDDNLSKSLRDSSLDQKRRGTVFNS
jgi:hypothetical protein